MKNLLTLMIAIIVMASCNSSQKIDSKDNTTNMLGAMLEDGEYIIISPTDKDLFVSKGDTIVLKRTWHMNKFSKRDHIYYTVYGKYIDSMPKTKVTHDSTVLFEYFKGTIL